MIISMHAGAAALARNGFKKAKGYRCKRNPKPEISDKKKV